MFWQFQATNPLRIHGNRGIFTYMKTIKINHSNVGFYIPDSSHEFFREKTYIGVSKNRDTLKWMVKTMENPIKMDDLGVPLYKETSISCQFTQLFKTRSSNRHSQFWKHPWQCWKKLPGFWVSFVPPPALLVVWEDLWWPWCPRRSEEPFPEREIFGMKTLHFFGGRQKVVWKSQVPGSGWMLGSRFRISITV